MEEDGIVSSKVLKLEVKMTVISYRCYWQRQVPFDSLYATGRKPNIEPLHLKNTDIAWLNVVVSRSINIWKQGSWCLCMGVMLWWPSIYHISLDDFRIVFNYLTGDGSYNLETRGSCSTAMFLNPPLACYLTWRSPEQQVDRLLSRNFQLPACLVAMLTVTVQPSKLW